MWHELPLMFHITFYPAFLFPSSSLFQMFKIYPEAMHTTEAIIFAIVAQVTNLLSSVSLPLCLFNWFIFFAILYHMTSHFRDLVEIS